MISRSDDQSRTSDDQSRTHQNISKNQYISTCKTSTSVKPVHVAAGEGAAAAAAQLYLAPVVAAGQIPKRMHMPRVPWSLVVQAQDVPGQFGLAVGLCRVFKPKHTVHFVTAAAVVAAVGAATAPQQGVRGVAAPSQRPARHLEL